MADPEENVTSDSEGVPSPEPGLIQQELENEPLPNPYDDPWNHYNEAPPGHNAGPDNFAELLQEILPNMENYDNAPNNDNRLRRKYRSLPESFRADATNFLDRFREFVSNKTRNATVTDVMKSVCILIQDAFEEYLGLHRDPAEDINFSNASECPKIHFLLERFKTMEEEETNGFYETLCIHYIRDSHDDPDMQYYATIILYSIVQGFSSSSEDSADDMRIFFENDNIFDSLMHLMAVDPPENRTLQLPARHIREIRALLCGVYGTLFERAVVNDYGAKFPVIRSLIPGHLRRLRTHIASFKPVVHSTETQTEPTLFQVPQPGSSQPRKSLKRGLERMKSAPDSSSTPSSNRRKRPKLGGSSKRLDFDENSSSSSWVEYERLQIGEVAQNFKLFPMDDNLEVRLVMDFLVGVATLQEFSTLFLESHVLILCFDYLDARKKLNSRILGQVVHLLANLLAYPRFATKFLESPIRLNQLIKIPAPSIPSVFVVKAFMSMVTASEYSMETMVKYADLVQGLTAFMVEAGLKSGHESPRKWAAKFFSVVLTFKPFLEAFDEEKVDGLRALLNMMGHYDNFWKTKAELERQLTTEEQLTSAYESLLPVFQALICYFTTDMVIKADQFRTYLSKRSREQKKEIILENKFIRVLPNKAIRLEKEELDDVRDFMLLHVPLWRSSRDRVLRFVKLEGMQRLLRIMEIKEVAWTTNRDFSVMPFQRMALEILEKCVLSRCGQDVLINYTTTDNKYPFTGIGLLIWTAVKYTLRETSEGKRITDITVKKLALHVISNCVYGMRTGREPDEIEATTGNRKKPFANDPDHFESFVTLLRQHKCLEGMKRIIHEAEEPQEEPVRALACKVFSGMARSPSCKQVMSELAFFRTGEIQVLMRDPLTIDGSKEFLKFEKCAVEMLELIFDTKIKPPVPVDLPETVMKQDILKRTRITFSSQEVDMLLLGHLEGRGLRSTAACLKQEVGLNGTDQKVVKKEVKSRRSISPGVVRVAPVELQSSGLLNGPKDSKKLEKPEPLPVGQKNYILDATDAPATINGLPNLVGIVTNNFRAQHAQCEHPISVCPPFSLKMKHRCPIPTKLMKPPENVSMRMSMVGHPYAHTWNRGLDLRHIFRRMKQVAGFVFPSETAVFDPQEGLRSATFLGSRQRTLVGGTTDGYLVGYNVADTTKPIFYKACHEFECDTHHMAMAPTVSSCDVFLSCCSEAVSTLWKFNGSNDCTVMKQYEQTDYMAFPHLHSNLALGSEHLHNHNTYDAKLGTVTTAFIVDLEIGSRLLTFQQQRLQGHYARNRPSFHPSDDLITHDGLLFDARTGQLINKFDQFERHTANGVFHPNGNQIIIDEQVWDLRNFKLMRSVPAFHQSFLKFNSSGDVLYALHFDKEIDAEDSSMSTFPGTFSIVDSRDYSTIAGIDCKRKFQCLALDTLDNYVMFGEPYNDNQSTYGRLFQIGLDKGEEEGDDEHDEDDRYLDDDDDEDDDDMTNMFEDDEDHNYDDDMLEWDEEDGDLVDEDERDEDDEWTTDGETEPEDEDEDDYVYELGGQ